MAVCLDQWRCVLCDDIYKVGLASSGARLDPDIVDDRVHEEVRSDHVSYHFVFAKAAPVQQLLVEQNDTSKLRQPNGDSCSMFFIGLQQSSVFVFIHP